MTENAARCVAVLGRIADAGLSKLAAAGLRYIELPDHAPERFAAVGEADAIIVRMTPIDEELLAAAPRLRIVSRHGVGYDTVDVNALTRRGIPLTVTGDVNSGAVAEHTLALILALAKRIPVYDAATRKGQFAIRDTFSTVELTGRTILLLGYGRIGRKVAALAAAFGMRVLIYDPFVKAEDVAQSGFSVAPELLPALGKADFVTVHLPKSPETTHLINATALSAMRRDAFLVNVARGGLVDEQALAEALDEGRIAGAALDVFETEPPAPSNPLLACENAVLSPHSAAFTRECVDRMAVASAENVIAYFAGNLDRSLVINPETLGGQPGSAA